MVKMRKTFIGNYKADDVECYVRQIRSELETTLKEQSDRITELKEENILLKDQVTSFKEKETHILDTMQRAEKMSSDIIDDANLEAAKRLYRVAEKEKQLQKLSNIYVDKLVAVKKYMAMLLTNIIEVIDNLKSEEDLKASSTMGRNDFMYILESLKSKNPGEGKRDKAS